MASVDPIGANTSTPDLTEWCLDSGATTHLCNNISAFSSIEAIEPITVDTASGKQFQVNKKGIVHLYLRSYEDTKHKDIACEL